MGLSPDKPSLGHYDVPQGYKNDLEMLDRYTAFSAEILRIALLGLSGLGLLVSSFLLVAKRTLTDQILTVPDGAKRWVIASALAFGCSAAAAVLHRYVSADSMDCHLRILRLELTPPSDRRKCKLERERKSLAAAEAFKKRFAVDGFHGIEHFAQLSRFC